MRLKQFAVMVLILFIALFLRVWHLGQNPPALSWDEAAWGYNAYSLGMTGRDEFGKILPLTYLESFGDFKPPLYAYLTIPSVKIFGLNEFATRLPSAVFGSLTVLLTFFLTRELFRSRFKRDLLSILASFFLAISPWHIMLSRAAFEANVATFFLVAGVTFFLLGMRKAWFFVLSAISFSLSLYTFNTARIMAPLLVLILVAAFYKKLWQNTLGNRANKKWVVGSFLLGVAIILPLIFFLITPQAATRYKEVNIFSDNSIVIDANQEIVNDGGVWWSKIIHNRRWGYTLLFLRHYFDHFNPSFLFIKGDGNPKFSTQDVGELYLWDLPFILAGIYFLFKKKDSIWWLVPLWLLLGIVPSALARETPHALRIETTLPTWQILIALGFAEIWTWVSQSKKNSAKVLLSLSIVFLLTNFIYFQHGYWRHYSAEYAQEWQYGYKEAVNFISQVEDKYDEIWFTDKLGRPYIYFLYYLKKNPTDFAKRAIVKRDVFGFVFVESLGKYHFWRLGERIEPKGKALIFDAPEGVSDKTKIVKSFYLPNGQEALVAYER